MKKKSILALSLVIGFVIIGTGCITTDDSTEQLTITIGGKTFNEQYILAEMISLLFEEQGIQTEVQTNLNDGTLYSGIQSGQIDVYVEYTGTAYSQLLKLEPLDVWDVEEVYLIVSEELLKNNITVLFRIGFRDDYAIAVTETWGAANNVTNITGLQPYAADMIFGSDLVFHEREDGLPRLDEVYNITFKEVKSMQPTLMYEAIKTGEVDAIPPYTTDTRVDSYNLRILTDDQAALPPYETMLLIRTDLAQNTTIVGILSVLEDLIDTDTMRTLNAEFDVDKREARDIAQDYLVAQGLIGE